MTVDHLTYPNRLEDGGYNTETEQGCMYVHDDIAIQIDHLLKRDIKPVYLTNWRDERVAIAATEKLQSVRLADGSPYNRRDISVLLKEHDNDIIHPMGFVKATNVCWNDELHRVEVSVGGLWNWVPVVGVENQTKELVYEIEHTGYVRWDISDLAPQQTEENRNHVDETNSEEQSL